MSKSPYCSSISVPELFPQYEARKAIRKPVQMGINHKPSESLFLILTIVIDYMVRRAVQYNGKWEVARK